MTEIRSLTDLTVSELLDELGAPSPVPGVGAAAALTVATAASVVGMAARLSEDWPDANGIAAQAESLRLRASSLADAGTEAYGDVLRLRNEPAETHPERRDFALGRAFTRAADLPLAIAAAGEDVAELAAVTADLGDHAYRADAAGASALAAAAARAAANLVAINLATTEDDPRLGQAQQHATAAAEAAERALRDPAP